MQTIDIIIPDILHYILNGNNTNNMVWAMFCNYDIETNLIELKHVGIVKDNYNIPSTRIFYFISNHIFIENTINKDFSNYTNGTYIKFVAELVILDSDTVDNGDLENTNKIYLSNPSIFNIVDFNTGSAFAYKEYLLSIGQDLI